PAAAATGGTRASPWWPGAACGRGRSWARPTRGRSGPGASRTRRRTCWPRSTTSWGSTRPPPSPTTRGGRSTCSTTATWSGSWSDNRAWFLRPAGLFRGVDQRGPHQPARAQFRDAGVVHRQAQDVAVEVGVDPVVRPAQPQLEGLRPPSRGGQLELVAVPDEAPEERLALL